MIRKISFIVLSIFFISCNFVEKEVDMVSEIKAIEENEDLKKELIGDNDDVSFQLKFSYDAFSGKKNILKTLIYYSSNYNDNEVKQKLQEENKTIQYILQREMKSFSSIDEMNIYLIQKGDTIDKISVNLKK